MIPSTIHYCWFGNNPKSQMMIECIESWRRFCPEYEIIEWNESNYPIERAPEFVKDAYAAKKWAFVSDYARLQIIYENGGIYLDTDVKLIKCLDPLLNNRTFFGMEYNGMSHSNVTIATGLGFGSVKHSLILKELMNRYNDLAFKEERLVDFVCTDIAMPIFLAYGFNEKNEIQTLRDGTVIYPTEFFGSYNHYAGEAICMTNNSYSLHLYSSTWTNNTQYVDYQRYLYKKYGEKKWVCGRAEKIEVFWNDVYNIKNDKGLLVSFVWGLKNIYKAYCR